MYAVLAAFVGHWYLSLFCQTFFLHRYSAHKMFTMNKFWEKFFYAFVNWFDYVDGYCYKKLYFTC